MRLIRLYIKDNGILKDFVLDFPQKPDNNISVFIGENGSGKTTVLESITKIFSWFIRNKKPEFIFELTYLVRLEDLIMQSSTWIQFKTNYILVKLFSNNDIVDIECNIGDKILKGLHEIRGNKELSSIKQNIKDNKYKLLPDSIAIYYAGESTIIKNIVSIHNKEYSESIRELYVEEKKFALHSFFYYEPFHFNLILLALLSFEYGNVPKILERKIQYNSIHNFTITLKKPYWAKGNLNLDNNDFWGAKGKISIFLRQLAELSSRKQKTSNGISLHFEEGNSQNLLYKLKDLYGTEKDFFKIIEMTWLNDLIESIDVCVKKNTSKSNAIVNSNRLSEGEKQSIIILGINELVLQENSLAMFDEPDTYLHPQWQRDFIVELESHISKSDSHENEYIITSHSPNIVSGIKKENLFVLKNGQIKEIPFNNYGKNVESLLIDFFDVDGVRNKYVENDLLEIQELIKRNEYNSDDFKEKFKKIKEIVGPTAPEIVSINLEIARRQKK